MISSLPKEAKSAVVAQIKKRRKNKINRRRGKLRFRKKRGERC